MARLIAAAVLLVIAAAPTPLAPYGDVAPTPLPEPTVPALYRPLRAAAVPARPAAYAGCTSALASFYGAGEPLNVHASDGSVFDPTAPTVAHRTLPLGTNLIVVAGDRAVTVTVTDRGPALWTGADVDLAAVGVWDALDLNRNAGRTTVRLCPTEGTD